MVVAEAGSGTVVVGGSEWGGGNMYQNRVKLGVKLQCKYNPWIVDGVVVVVVWMPWVWLVVAGRYGGRRAGLFFGPTVARLGRRYA